MRVNSGRSVRWKLLFAGDSGAGRGRARSPRGGSAALVLAVLSLSALATTPARPPGGTGAFQKGMVLGIFSKNDPDYFRSSLGELQELGVNSICLIVPKVQKDVRSVGFYDDPWITPTDESLRLATREAHRRGMRVLMLPIVYVEDLEEGEWRGTIHPPDWDAWFRAYQALILHYARIAAAEKIEYFSVGSELCSTERFRSRWRKVIRSVRQIYPGSITYSANWDHLEPVSFGDDLDFLGMNAYYEVGKDSGDRVTAMVDRWHDIQRGIRSWKEANGGRPLVITEVGYPSRQGAAVNPWNYFGEGAPDEEEQRKCYEAFVRAWKGETMLAGVYFYLWWGEGGLRDRDYTPRGKSAQEVLRGWYRNDEVPPGPPTGTVEVTP